MQDDRQGAGTRLSPMQEGMLFHHLSGGPGDVDLQQIVVDLPETVDETRLRDAWTRAVERHPALRSSFVWGGDRPPSRIVHPRLDLPYERAELGGRSADEREAAFTALVEAERARGFDPGRAPLFRLRLARFGPEAHRLLWSFHHLVMDGRSAAFVLRELFEDLASEGDAEIPEPVPYDAYLDWLEARDAASDEDFWREALAGFRSATPVPGGRGPGARPAPPGEAPVLHERRLTEPETRRLTDFCSTVGVSLNALVQAGWALLLSRYAGETDIVYGVTRAARSPELEGADRMVGVLIQTHPVRVEIEPGRSVASWLAGLKDAHRAMGDRWLADLPDVLSWSDVGPGAPLFETLYMYDHEEMTSALSRLGGGWESRSVRIVERPPYAITLYAYGEPELLLRLAVDPGRVEADAAPRLLELLRGLLLELADDPDREVGRVRGLPEAERRELLEVGRGPRVDLASRDLVHEEILARGRDRARAVALVAGDRSITFGELAGAVRAAAAALEERGVGRGSLVGIHGDRSIETVTALLGVLTAGAAYVPLDPDYPEARLRFMVEDAGLGLVLAGPGGRVAWGEEVEVVPMGRLADARRPAAATRAPDAPPRGDPSGREGAAEAPRADVRPDDLAYVIYTSGSTGRPKGVMLEHESVRNFLAGMDEAVGGEPGTWLSVTPLSFDISVLELLWTLSRGWRVALPDPAADERAPAAPGGAAGAGPGSGRNAGAEAGAPDFGLFYFAAASAEEARDGYRLLLDGARKADELGLSAVWTPERHFHAFGGLYPNPAVTGSAVAAVTRRLAVRAGSVVLPLHDPIRVAEEWSVIDHLTGGRAGVAFASGWQKDDFVLAPDRYENRHEEMLRAIDIVQRLWRGEEVFRPGADGEPVGVRLHPRPVQPSLPMWLTAAGSPDTFRRAGEIGAGVLTHLLGQSVEDLGERIAHYREARLAAGHGPDGGHVVVMLHTFVGSDDGEVRALVREPLRAYLRSSVSLIKNYSTVWASRTRRGTRPEGDEFARLDPEDLDAILDQAFERYYETSGLLGPVDKCAELVRALRGVGVDEIACLIDFGVATDRALAGLDDLAALRDALAGRRPVEPGAASAWRASASEEAPGVAAGLLDVPDLIARHGVTHMQCTPSLVRLLLADRAGREALASLRVLLVGGEALSAALARELRETTTARIVNMYGPTETAVWSSTAVVRGGEAGIVPIGRPIANTALYVLGPSRELLPHGAEGELYIGGAGVARGYLGRPGLTEERFLPDPFGETPGARLYRTGDRVRWRGDGALEFLGRADQQVKLRGHRVEPGEIEAVLRGHQAVAEAAVVVRGEGPEARLVGYVVPAEGRPDGAALAAWLQDRLPDVMVPRAWVTLDALPLTPNGKIDRNALPEAAGDAPAEGLPGDTVEAVAGIWGEVLGVVAVAPEDDFFALGGNSLSTIQVAFRIRKTFGVELPLRTFFAAPTVAALAGRIEEELLAAADAEELERLMAEMEELSDEEARRLVGRE